jgi:hypothetical protein
MYIPNENVNMPAMVSTIEVMMLQKISVIPIAVNKGAYVEFGSFSGRAGKTSAFFLLFSIY